MAAKFRTIFDRRISVSNPGSALVDDFVSIYDEDGKRKVVKNGQYNLWDEIQSYRESCDLKMILKRYINTGDESLLERRKGFYADVTEMPKTYAEVLNLTNAANELFNSLDTDKKLMFNNNPDEFLASIGTDKFNEVMGISKDGGASPNPNGDDKKEGEVNE